MIWVILACCAGAIAVGSMVLAFILPRGMAKVIGTIIASLIYIFWANGQQTELGAGGFVIWIPLVAFCAYWCARTGAHVVETLKA